MLAAVLHCHAQDVCKTVNTILIEVHQHCCMVVKGGPWVMLYCSIFLYLIFPHYSVSICSFSNALFYIIFL
jgi:hypothetical protein